MVRESVDTGRYEGNGGDMARHSGDLRNRFWVL